MMRRGTSVSTPTSIYSASDNISGAVGTGFFLKIRVLAEGEQDDSIFLFDHVGKVGISNMIFSDPVNQNFSSDNILPLSHHSIPHNSLCSLSASKSGIVISFTTRLVHPVKCWVR